MSKTRSAGELAFIDQETRRLTVGWARKAINDKDNLLTTSDDRVYVDYAVSKKWVSLKEVGDGGRSFTLKLLASGWKTAAAFLKR
jgi:hypothetical protein